MAQNTPTQARIVVGVDASDNAAAAAAWAAREAADRGLTLHLVHAIDAHVFSSVPERPEIREREEAAATVLLASAADALRTGFPALTVTASVSELSAAGAMVVSSRDSELVVTGTRGHGGFAGMLLGSVSLKVAAHAHGPVVVVRGRPAGDERNEVVLGVEHGQDPAAIRFAFEAAARYGASVRAVRAWWPALVGYGAFPAAPGVSEQHKVEAVGLDETLETARADFPAVEVVTEVACGNAVSILLAAAHGSRLLVVGAHRIHGPLSVGAGYVVQGLLAHSPTPVAVVPVAG